MSTDLKSCFSGIDFSYSLLSNSRDTSEWLLGDTGFVLKLFEKDFGKKTGKVTFQESEEYV